MNKLNFTVLASLVVTISINKVHAMRQQNASSVILNDKAAETTTTKTALSSSEKKWLTTFLEKKSFLTKQYNSDLKLYIFHLTLPAELSLDDVTHFKAALTGTRACILNLSNSQFPSLFCKDASLHLELLDWLITQQQETLTHLDLTNCNLHNFFNGSNYMYADLYKSLKQCSKLTHLYLNNDGNEIFSNCSSMIKAIPTLTHLELKQCSLGESTVWYIQDFFDSVGTLTALKEIDLRSNKLWPLFSFDSKKSYNEIACLDIHARILQPLMKIPTIEKIFLANNNFPEKEVECCIEGYSQSKYDNHTIHNVLILE